MYSHNIFSLLSPHFFPIAALHAKKRFLHFMILFEMCSSHFNWSSNVMPKYFVLLDSSLDCWLIMICSGFSLWFVVQHMIWVLGALISSPWLEHHSDTIFTCFSVVSMTVANGKIVFFPTGMFLVGVMTTASKMLQLKNPLRFGRITVKTVHCFCLACWLGATVFLTFVILMTYEENSIFSYRGYECFFTNSTPRLYFLKPIIAILSMLGPACVVVATTIYILVTAIKSAKRVRSNLKWQGTMATLLTAIFYILSSSPKVIYRILEYMIYSSDYKSNTNMFKHFYKVAESCLLLNTVSNLYIYCLTVTSFREFVFTTICRCHQPVGNVLSSHDHGK